MVKGVGGTYTIISNNEIYACFAQKKIKQSKEFLVGDYVEFSEEQKSFVITKILPRKNELLRPKVANITQLVIVIAPLPKPDLSLVDKLIIYANKYQIKTLLVVNKEDLLVKEFLSNIKAQYEGIVDKILLTSAKKEVGINELKEALKENVSVFAGQSAVGKSTLLNTLGFNLETGELSKKTDRGKHTTRHTELFYLNDSTFIADTPGFSLLELFEVEPDKLETLYTEFKKYSQNCKYRSCNHIHMKEEDCGVKKALTEDKLNKERYNRYVEHYNEVKKRWETKYD